ncbi:alpha/beta hydrolase family protein [Shewanella algae]|uniref:alpha/beta hydrolase family protein n=1 Tax=Shewanella algae TaxID=38313 RepID=UPI001182E9C2|nr:S9 family peptidase [Shewanella algae]TVL12649.1 peptidase S9 [Shewanella algae]
MLGKFIGLVLVLLLSSNVLAWPSLQDFSRHPEFYNVKISPDGRYLAVLINQDGRKTLAFMRTIDSKITYVLNASGRDQAGNYYWVNNERVVVEVEQNRGALTEPLRYGELYAVNYDGKKDRMIFGYRSKSGIALAGYAGFMLDTLKNDNEHILITKMEMKRNSDYKSDVVKLNVYTGRERKVKSSPIGFNQYLVDHDGNPRFVVGKDNDDNLKLFYSEGAGDKWQLFDSTSKGDFTPLTFSADNQKVYALKSDSGGPKGLYIYDLREQKEQYLYGSKIADPTYAISSNLNEVYGLRMDEDYPSYHFFRNDLKVSLIHDALVKAFGGDSVEITSNTHDGKLMVVHVSGDRNPGKFYLFDTETLEAKFLLASRSWLKTDDLVSTEAFRIQARDGLALTGYITLPKTSQKSDKYPTVILPHGGPHARDYWQFDPTVQLLASRGYAVVQVNFRGSSGFGEKFEHAGYGEWGTKIQDDIYSATQYVIDSGVADRERICIFGASFGGYSALQSAIRFPDTYKCAIGYAGVYDLPLLYQDGDIRKLKWGDAYLDKTVGTDPVKQKEMSPSYHVDKLRAAVFIAHGEEDERAPISQALSLKKALDDRGYPYEWMVKSKEGHGFYEEENIIEFNQKLLTFLAKHI